MEQVVDHDAERSTTPQERGLGHSGRLLKPLSVLLAEDNPTDVLLIREALTVRFPEVQLSVQEDGEQMMQAIDILSRFEAPWPDVILIDLNLPRITGSQALEKLRNTPLRGGVPVVIVTSSDAPQDRQLAERLGATRYFRKSSNYDEFMRLGEVVENVLGSPWT